MSQRFGLLRPQCWPVHETFQVSTGRAAIIFFLPLFLFLALLTVLVLAALLP